MRGYGILARYTQYGVWHKLEKIPDGLLNGMSKADSKSPAMSWNLNETLKVYWDTEVRHLKTSYLVYHLSRNSKQWHTYKKTNNNSSAYKKKLSHSFSRSSSLSPFLIFLSLSQTQGLVNSANVKIAMLVSLCKTLIKISMLWNIFEMYFFVFLYSF